MSRILYNSDMLELVFYEHMPPNYRKGHMDMLMHAWEAGEKKVPLTPNLITDLYQDLTGLRAYRNTAAFVGGTVCPDPQDIRPELRDLCEYYEKVLASGNATLQDACCFHIAYVRLHPWPDGNGRTGRALLQYFAARMGMLPIMIRHRDQYLNSLDCAKTLSNFIKRGG